MCVENVVACSIHPPASALNPITSLPVFSLGIAGLEGGSCTGAAEILRMAVVIIFFLILFFVFL